MSRYVVQLKEVKESEARWRGATGSSSGFDVREEAIAALVKRSGEAGKSTWIYRLLDEGMPCVEVSSYGKSVVYLSNANAVMENTRPPRRFRGA